MRVPKQTIRAHNRTVELAPEQYARKLRKHAILHLKAIVTIYRTCPPEVQSLLLGTPEFSTALAYSTLNQ
jgi:hypothetical protein